MTKLTVHGPDGRIETITTLAADRGRLFGRQPNLAAAEPSATALPTGRIDPQTIPDPSISANHALVWSEGDQTWIEDLHSRNGTWLRLPPGQAIHVRSSHVQLQLAAGVAANRALQEPPSPDMTDAGSYALSLVSALQKWPPLRDLEIGVAVTRDAGVPTSSAIPLPSGEQLDFSSRGTAIGDWSSVFEVVWRWVSRHNALYEAEALTRRDGMVLASKAIRTAHCGVIHAAQSDARTLLLTGPSGAGKEMLAEVFHRHSGQSGPFVAINCAMFTKDLLRAELFGAEPGSFTGATRRIVGAAERAEGGTLLLDEIGEVASDIQPMLLRFLDRREFEPVGCYGKPRRAQVRIVAATNQDLRALVHAGTFRADLWYRLSVHVVNVPGLSERWEDILEYLTQTRAPGSPYTLGEVLSPEALDALRTHAFEGNFRELKNFRERIERNALPSSVDRASCLLALQQGALRPLPEQVSAAPRPAAVEVDLAQIAQRATQAFIEDFGTKPASWDDQKHWNEKYLKPLLFSHLSGADAYAIPRDEGGLGATATRCAARVGADRGTALKQLARYYERFAP